MWRRGVLALVVLTVTSVALASQGAAPVAPEGSQPGRAQADAIALALATQRAGDWPAAARLFGEAAAIAGPIAEYALQLQAEALARFGDPAAPRVATQAVEQAGTGPLLPAALLLAGRESARVGDMAAAMVFYRRFLDRFSDHGDSPAARYGLADALESAGQGEEALRLYRGLWVTAPLNPSAPAARDRERALIDRGVPAPALTPRERVDRAERLLAGGQATQARIEADALVADGISGDPALRALRVTAEASRRLGKTDEALRAVDRALSLAPGERRATWLLERARLLQPRSPQAALVTLDRLVREHPRSGEASDALLLRAQLLESQAQPVEAEATYARLAVDYGDDDDAGRALWRLGWMAWFRRDFEGAITKWNRLMTLHGGQIFRENAVYWIGRAHEERGELDLATRQWTESVGREPRGYFGILATARLQRRGAAVPLARDLRTPITLPADALEALRDEPRYAKATALRAAGLGFWADGELDEVARRSAGETLRLYAVSTLFARDARYHLSLRILRREFLPLARAGYAWLPRPFWDMFYPLGWRAEIASAAQKGAVDPLLVSAVVREESSYNPLVRSRVGARGLMQLMPDTARPLARARGMDFRDGDILDDPAANVELGAAYLGWLVREFGEARLAVAAYNAGPNRVKEWWAARKSDDLEVWVEQIPYNETRNFVRRVSVGYAEYRRLYASADK